MKRSWFPILIGAILGAIECMLLYPLGGGASVFEFQGSDLLGQIGIVLTGVTGALCGAFGGARSPKEVGRRFRTGFREHRVKTCVAIGLLVVVMAIDVPHHLSGEEVWAPYGDTMYFMGAAFLSGLGVRFLYERCASRS